MGGVAQRQALPPSLRRPASEQDAVGARAALGLRRQLRLSARADRLGPHFDCVLWDGGLYPRASAFADPVAAYPAKTRSPACAGLFPASATPPSRPSHVHDIEALRLFGVACHRRLSPPSSPRPPSRPQLKKRGGAGK